MPGTIERDLIPALERASGRRAGEGFAVCYDPDFVALGETINGFLRPELVVIGETSEAAGARVEAIHRTICENTPHIARMGIASAEVAKVALNAYITMKISFANHLANICERLPGADVDAITRAVGTDSRISRKYFTGGMAYGGTCFPRDTVAYRRLAHQVGLPASLMDATDAVNDAQGGQLLEAVLESRSQGGAVGIVGVAFRTETPVITGSPAVALIDQLISRGIRVVAYDPIAGLAAREHYGDAIEHVTSLEACLNRASVAAITHRSQAFKTAIESYVPTHPITFVDCWRILDAARIAAPARVRPLGRWVERSSLLADVRR
jgi:UDPglucose 6-dehydrogenase